MSPGSRTARRGAVAWRALLALGLALLCAFLLWPSTEPAPDRRGLVHLLPLSRLDHRPTAERAVGATTVHETLFLEEQQEWGVNHGSLQQLPGGAPGRRGVLLQSEEGGTIQRAPQLIQTGLDWRADAISSVVVRVRFFGAHPARLYFRTAEDEATMGGGGSFRPQQFLELRTHATAVPEDLVFEVSQHPAWRGTIRAVRLDLVQGRGSCQLVGIRAEHKPAAAGASPTRLGDELLDLGLVRLARDEEERPLEARYEARRATAAFAGEDQYVHLPAGEARTLHLSYALPDDPRLEGPVSFELYVSEGARVSPDPGSLRDPGAWPHESSFVRRHAVLLDPSMDAGRWVAARVELEPSEPSILLLRTSGGKAEGSVNGLWGPLTLFESAQERPPSLVLITADTLRADHVSSYGNQDLSTPHIDALAARGSSFTNAYAECNATSPSHATILTGLFPKDHGVLGNRTLLPEEVVSLFERLRAAGYVTLASSGVLHLNSDLSGFGQGVDVYLDAPPPIFGMPRLDSERPSWMPPPVTPNVREPYREAAHTHAQLLPILEELGDQPFVLWVHYYDPHTPYAAEEEFEARQWSGPAGGVGEGPSLLERFARESAALNPNAGRQRLPDGGVHSFTAEELLERYMWRNRNLRFLGEATDAEYIRALYRAGIEQFDDDFGALVRALEPRQEDTLWIFTSDHGEGLGEHDVWFNHEGVYDETLHVPLILAGPGVPSARRVDGAVELVDLVPTVHELLDLPALDAPRGISLGPAMRGEVELGPRQRWFQHAGNFEVGWQDEREHVIVSLKPHSRGGAERSIAPDHVELYDRSNDPGLERNLAPDAQRRAQEVRARAEAWLEERAVDAQAQSSAMDAASLQDLGYGGHMGGD